MTKHRTYEDPAWRKLRTAYRRRHPLCEAQGCGKPAPHVDHIVNGALCTTSLS